MTIDQAHIEKTALDLAQELKTPEGRERWRTDPLSVLKGVGLSFDTLDQDKREVLSKNLGSINPAVGSINYNCVACQTIIFAAVVGVEVVVVLVIIAALIAIIASMVDGEGEAVVAAAAIELDVAGEAGVAAALEEAEVVAVDVGAEATGIPGAAFARACVTAFKAAARLIVSKPALSFTVSTVVTQFDRVLANEICKAQGHCT